MIVKPARVEETDIVYMSEVLADNFVKDGADM
jgi:hypothetical protein